MNVDDNKVQEFLNNFKSFLPHLKFDPPSRIMTAIVMALIVIWAVLRLAFKLAWSDLIIAPVIVLEIVVCIRCLRKKRLSAALSAVIGIVLAVSIVLPQRFFGVENYSTIHTAIFVVYLALFVVRGIVEGREEAA